MKSKEELKKLFENGDKPTQEEFWEWQDSYWHKGEKLPLETAGLYKIKGSVGTKTDLDFMTSMTEGDVYNVIETGDNYVYVLNLNNMGEAGWDKLGGLSDLSAINLQTVLDNGNYAQSDDANKSISIDLENGVITSNISNDIESTGINQEANSISLSYNYPDGEESSTTFVTVGKSGLEYYQNYSQRPEFNDRTLVDKGYVDSKITPNTLQQILDTGYTAINPNTESAINLSIQNNEISFILKNAGTTRTSSIRQDFHGFTLQRESTYDFARISSSSGGEPLELTVFDKNSSESTLINITAFGAMQYGQDYSYKFNDRTLVDKGYVDNATSTLNYLPLSGTEIGKPLTGNIALSYANFISGSNGYNSRLDFSGDSVELYSTTPMFTNSVRVSSDAVVLRSNAITNPGSYAEIYVREGLIRIATAGSGARGLTGDDDYTANITALDYAQKKYVDDAIANFTTPIEEIVLAGSNGLTGKIRYEKRGEFMNIHVDITVGELQVDESFSTILPFDLKTSFIVHPMITDIVNYFYTDIIIKTDGNDLLFINKTDTVITGGLIKQSFVFALGAD